MFQLLLQRQLIQFLDREAREEVDAAFHHEECVGKCSPSWVWPFAAAWM